MISPGSTIYVGTFRHNIDSKGRLTIPSKWRFTGDEKDVYLAVPHPVGYIQVMPPAEVERLNEKVAEMKMSDRDAQDFMVRFFAEAQSFGCDKQGRIPLNAELLAHADIKKEAVMTGALRNFRIYNPERWDAEQARTKGEAFGNLMKRIDF